MIDILQGIPEPTPEAVRKSRELAGLPGHAAAKLAGLGSRDRWYEYERGERNIEPMRWAAWLLEVDQHPTLRLAKRRQAAEPVSDAQGGCVERA